MLLSLVAHPQLPKVATTIINLCSMGGVGRGVVVSGGTSTVA